jgi:hypothetical protein
MWDGGGGGGGQRTYGFEQAGGDNVDGGGDFGDVDGGDVDGIAGELEALRGLAATAAEQRRAAEDAAREADGFRRELARAKQDNTALAFQVTSLSRALDAARVERQNLEYATRRDALRLQSLAAAAAGAPAGAVAGQDGGGGGDDGDGTVRASAVRQQHGGAVAGAARMRCGAMRHGHALVVCARIAGGQAVAGEGRVSYGEGAGRAVGASLAAHAGCSDVGER